MDLNHEDFTFNEQKHLLNKLVEDPLFLLMDVNYKKFLVVNKEQIAIVMNNPPIFDEVEMKC